MKVREILTKDPEVIRPDASLTDAAEKMRQFDIGMLPVCENDRLIGCVTDRDITIRGVAEGGDPKTTPVRDVMSQQIFYCFDDQDLEEAGRCMEEKQVRRLPVLNRDKRLVGIIALADFAVRSREPRLTEEVLEEVSEPVGSY